MLAYIVPIDGSGGRPDQGLPSFGHPGNALPVPPNYPSNRPPGSGARPDQGLPGSQPGADNSLPGGGYPSHGLPGAGSPDNSLPGGSGGSAGTLPRDEAWLLAYHPNYGYKWIPAGSMSRPDQGLPGGSGGRPDQGLPGEQPEIDNETPGGKPRPDQGLPPGASPKK